MTTTWIAEQPVVFLYGDSRRSGRIAIGLPVQINPTEARCSVLLDGLDVHPIGIVGMSSLQALLLSVRFLGMRLHDFLSKGGRVLDPGDGSETALDGLFGPMLQRAVPPRATPTARRPRRRAARRTSSKR
jgi:hypothetical protein